MLLRKSARDHERFLATFRSFEMPAGSVWEDDDHRTSIGRQMLVDQPLAFCGRRLVHHRALSGRHARAPLRADGRNAEPTITISYHPLLIESHFALLLARLLLGDFTLLIRQHYRTARIMDALDGGPIFVTARSLCQSEVCDFTVLVLLRLRPHASTPSCLSASQARGCCEARWTVRRD